MEEVDAQTELEAIAGDATAPLAAAAARHLLTALHEDPAPDDGVTWWIKTSMATQMDLVACVRELEQRLAEVERRNRA